MSKFNSVILPDGRKISGAAAQSHIIKKCGGIEQYSAGLFNQGALYMAQKLSADIQALTKEVASLRAEQRHNVTPRLPRVQTKKQSQHASMH